ncbi:MAG TPA: D-alanyl-D-alanine carboxypeptidase family protein, partial [Thermoleophilaceae bacterium]|nr:D-alanyl-D-alanine carboxypeptidase family protein [Thermoleophilaceae bacterium]
MARTGPPPVPHRPALQGGGRRRSRLPRLIAIVAILAAPAGVAAAAYVSLGDGGAGGASSPPLAVGSPPVAGAPEEPREPAPLIEAEPVPDVPLGGVDAFHVRLRKPPRAGLVFDVDTGEVLWRRRPMLALPMASLTKIMTALLAVERGRPDDPVRITPAALHYTGSGIGLLQRGRRVRFETLLNGLLIVSGNDAAIALAVHLAGSERRFVALMNERARLWGLECTHFASSHGLEDANRSCARDLAVMTRLAMAEPRIRRIARRRQVDFRFPVKGGHLYLYGHNPLIRLGYPGAIGLKTGYTDAAGRCFVGVARRNGRRLAVVLLNSRDPSKHAPKLL